MVNLLRNKKGAEMTVGTVIIIILALVVLVFLIFAFTRSTGSLTDNIKNFFGGSSNVDTIKNACMAACTTNQVYEYTKVPRDVKFDKDTKVTGVTCKDLETSREAGCYSGNVKAVGDISSENCKGDWAEDIGEFTQVSPCKINGLDQSGIKDKAVCLAFAWQPAYTHILDACTTISSA